MPGSMQLSIQTNVYKPCYVFVLVTAVQAEGVSDLMEVLMVGIWFSVGKTEWFQQVVGPPGFEPGTNGL